MEIDFSITNFNRMIFKNGKFTEAANEDFTVIRQRLNSQL